MDAKSREVTSSAPVNIAVIKYCKSIAKTCETNTCEVASVRVHACTSPQLQASTASYATCGVYKNYNVRYYCSLQDYMYQWYCFS